MVAKGNFESGAAFSPCGKYRYRLWRRWGMGKTVLWVLLNPSTADENVLDPTLIRCMSYSKAWGYDGFEVCNLFAIRATDPRVMLADPEPVGPRNDYEISWAASFGVPTVIGWGNHGAHLGRAAAVLEMLRNVEADLKCLRVTKAGQPSHPLYLSKNLKPIPFEVAK